MADNYTILANVAIENGTDYQQRIPAPSQAMTAQTYNALMNPLNGRYYDMFTNSLLRRIRDTVIHNDSWTNPLADEKRLGGTLGFSTQEIAQQWIKAHSYADEETADSLVAVERPEYAQWFHTMNSQRKYKLSMNRQEIAQAFVTNEGLQSIIDNNAVTVINSEEYDDYLAMENLFSEHAHRWGFATYNLASDPFDETTTAGIRELSKKIREFTGLWRWPSTLYNHVDVPVFAAQDARVIFYDTPGLEASLDVDFLANVFNVELADITVTRRQVRTLPVNGAVGVLTVPGFFLCSTDIRETREWENPDTLTRTFWYHAWDTYSTSPFVPAILFIYDSNKPAGLSVPVTTINYTGIDVTVPSGAKLDPAGGVIQLSVQAQGTPTVGKIKALTQGTGSSSVINQGVIDCYVDDLWRLHYPAGLNNGDTLTITATSTYVNPDSSTGALTDTVSVVAPDTTLSALTIGTLTLTPTFSSRKYDYTVTTTASTNAVTATATDTTNATVAIKVNGATHTSGQSATWQDGKNTVEVTVTNGGLSSVYNVKVTKS